MWTFLFLLLVSIGLCHGQPSSTTKVHGALPTHTCRIVLRGTTEPSGDFSLSEFSINCWLGDAAGGAAAGSSSASNAAGGEAGVAVRLGRSLFNHVTSSTDSTVTLLGVDRDWRTSSRLSTSVRGSPVTGPDYNDDGYADEYTWPLKSSIIEAPGCNPSDDGCGDWGINILDVPHLQLVDSWVSGVPLSGASPLLQCLNCSLLTARNLTLQDLQPQVDQSGSSPFGAVRVTGLQSTVLERISCAGVWGARGWACILLQPQPNGTIIIRDSSFVNNTVMDNGYGSRPPPPMPPEPPPLSPSPPPSAPQTQEEDPGTAPSTSRHLRRLSAGDSGPRGSSSSSGESDVLEVEMLRCSKDGDHYTDVKLPGYGAVLILYNLDAKYCDGRDNTTAADASVLVEKTIISKNSGGCGAGISVSHMAANGICGKGRHVRIAFLNGTVTNNTAAMYGGGLYLLNYIGSTTSIAVGNLSVLSFNTAGKKGGGAALFSTYITDLAITDADVSHNAATASGGGLHVESPTIAALTVSNSNFLHNMANGDGGAIYVEGSSVGSIRVNRASTLDRNSADSDGGALFIKATGGLASLVVEEGSRMFENSAGKDGGAIYASSSKDFLELRLDGGATLAANRAEDGCGGALYLKTAQEGISALSFMDAVVLSNTASCKTSPPTDDGVCGHGGAIHAEATAGTFNITGQSVFANNTAHGVGGAIHAEAALLADIYFTGQLVFANNTAQDHGGAVFVKWEKSGASQEGVFLTGASFVGNTAVKGSGGSIYLRNLDGNISSLEISNSSFVSNTAARFGGAMHLDLATSRGDSGVLGNVAIKDGSTFFHNWVNGTALGLKFSYGGALSLGVSRIDQPLEITGHSSMVNNSASGDGGAIHVNDGARQAGLLISGNSNVSNNTAGVRGGFMLLNNGDDLHGGVLIRLEAGSVASHNYAVNGGFLYASSNLAVKIEVVGSQIVHNTAQDNAGAIYLLNGKSLDVGIKDGSNISFNTAKEKQGGACWLRVLEVGNVKISNDSSVSWNRAHLDGGGMYIESSSLSGNISIVVDGASTVQNNEAGGSGGGIFVQAYGVIDNISIANQSRLENNKAGGNGGAMAINVVAVANGYIHTISWDGGSTLSNNNSTGRGGGLFAKANTVNAFVRGGSQWNGNTAEGDGGALCIDTSIDTSNYPITASSVSVAGGSQLNGNRAANGGAMHIRGYANVTVSDGSTVSDNTADYEGGAAVLTQLSPSFRLESCSVSGNKASRGSGGAFLLMTDVPVLPKDSTDSSCSPCTLPTMVVGIANAFLADNTAGAAHGGAFYIKPHSTCCGGDKTNITFGIENSRFISNKALGIGGAIAFLDVSDAFLAFDVTSSNFSGNSAGLLTGDFTSSVNYGGAIIIWREPRDTLRNITSLCHLNATSTSFEANSCNGGSGGAVTLISCSSRFSGCNFTANRATLSGGAVASLHLPRRSATLGLTTSSGLPDNPGISIAGQSQSIWARRRRRLHDVHPTQTADGFPTPSEDPDWVPRRDSRPASSRRKLWGTYPWDGDSNCYTDSANWSVIITECNFHSNYADLEFGGALYLYASSDAGQASIDNSNFTENKAVTQHAGAVFLAAKGDYTRVQLTNSLFDSNTAQAASAGAVYVLLGLHACGALVNMSLVGNRAGTSGGGCVLDVRSNGTLVIQNVTAVRNYAISGDGGAVQLQVQRDGSASITGCGFHENTAAGNGGAVLLDGNCSSYLSLQYTNMSLNRAGLSGGALYASYAAKEGRTSEGSAFGFAPGAINGMASPCSSDASFNGQQRMSVGLVTFTQNKAGRLGGAVFVAPASTVTLLNLSMSNNTACKGGGSMAAENCSSLVLSQSTLHSSHTTGGGGGFYANGCRRILFEFVDVAGNTAGVSGGGLMISGAAEVGGAATNFNSYTSMLLHRVRVSGNAAAGQSSNASGSCKVDSTLQTGIGMGGGLFIEGRVVGALSRSDLKQPNVASFGPAVAMALRCYPNITTLPLTGSQAIDPEEIKHWRNAWAGLDSLADLQCWMLQLSDTLIPPIVKNAPTKDLSIWVDDFLASALHARCDVRYQTDQQYQNETADLGGIRNAVATRLVDTRKRVLNGTQFPAGQVLPLVRDGSISGAAEIAGSLSSQRLKQLALQLDDCIDQSTSSNLTESQRTEAAKTHPYIGLPATYIGLLLNVGDQNMTVGHLNLQLQTGVSFDLKAQLYDMFQQMVTTDMSPSNITLRLWPRPPDGGSYNETAAADGSAPWLINDIAYLDPGLNRSLEVPVINGLATWGAVTAYAWPGFYSLVLDLSASTTPFVKVARLVAEIEILPCTVGKTLDLSHNSVKASWTGCKKCGLGQYGLWVDNRPRLTDLHLSADELYTAEGGASNKTLFLKKMNDTVHADDHAVCKPCPTNALCLGGALIVPEQGHWHSAANSTQIHSCPNPTACSSATDDGRKRFPGWLQEMGPQLDQRTKLLLWCQLVWYSSVVPGEAVQAAYFSPDDYDALSPSPQIFAAGSQSNVSVLLNKDATQWQQTSSDDGDTFNCLLFGLGYGDSDSYMQQQCLEGYTGNLCASCISGYYVDSDFNCKRCPELVRTIALGLVSFFSSVILVLFTTMTNFAEGFSEKDGRQAAAHALLQRPPPAAGAAAEDPVELGDVVKVIVLHLQYLIIVTRLSVDYPSVILRCQAVFGAVTGAENYLVYSPSCLKPNNDSGGQALIQWLASILTPCVVTVVSMLLWTLRYAYPLRKLAAEAFGSGLRSAWAGRLGVRKALAAWRERKSSHQIRSDTQSVCGSEGSAVMSRQLEFSSANFPLPGTQSTEASLEPLEGGGGIGLCTIFRDVQVVAFDASDIGGGGAEAPAATVAATLPPISPPRPYSLDSSPPPALPTAGSAALVVDLDGVEGGFTVKVPEPDDAPDASAFGTNPQQQLLSLYSSRAMGVTTVLPEDDRLDRLSDPPGILRASDAHGGGYTAAGAPPLLGTARSMYTLGDGIRIRGAPTTVLAGGASFGGGGGGGGGGSLIPVPYYRHPYNELWHRKMPKTLSYRGSAAINDAIKTLHKLRTLAVSTQQSSQATFVQVDKAMSLREQLGVVLMAAVFILYPSWAHAALSTFACYPIDDGEGPFPEGQQATWLFGYWIRDMQMQCYSGNHLSVYVPIGVVAVLLFCVLPPLASFLFVWRVRGRLADNHVRKVYGFLYKRYKPRYIWWETALQLETLILVTVEVLGRGLPVSSQALLLAAVFVVIALINVSFAPLLSRLLVIMEFLSLGTLILTIILSLYFTVDNGLNPAAENALAILIITINTSLMFFFLYIASRHYWPSAVRKVAPTAQAVMRKISSIGSTAGNQHRSAEMDGNQARFRWTVFGRLTAWRQKPDAGSDSGNATSSSDADVPGPHSQLERLSDAYSDGLSGCESAPLGVMAKGLDIARASISLDDRLSSCSTEPARLVYTSSHVCIQLEDANGGGRA